MRLIVSVIGCAAMMTTALFVMPASAQDPRTPLPSDTTRILRGFSDFSRYRTPGMCYATVQALTKRARRTWAKDTVPAGEKLRWALPAAAVDAGKQCARRFTVAKTAPSELQNLELLALAIGDDTLAASVVQRRLALAQTLRDSGDVLEQSATALIQAEPARRDQAIATLARLEQLGTQAGVASVRAHLSVLFRLSMGFDAPAQQRIAAAGLAGARKLSLSDRDALAGEIQMVWTIYLQALMFESFDSIPVAGERMTQDMASIRNGTYSDFSTMFRDMFATQIFPYLR